MRHVNELNVYGNFSSKKIRVFIFLFYAFILKSITNNVFLKRWSLNIHLVTYVWIKENEVTRIGEVPEAAVTDDNSFPGQRQNGAIG